MKISLTFWRRKSYFKPELGYELCRPSFGLQVGYFELSLTFRARRKWSELHNSYNDYERHLVWGCISLSYGKPGLEPLRVCSYCDEEIQTVGAGDEIWDWCESCQQTEGDTHEITMREYERIHA